MKIDVMMSAVAPAAVAEEARAHERAGFDCMWTFEARNDPFLPLSHAAAATSTLQVGTNIAVAFARSPFSMAQVAWNIQRDSAGRLRLGLGTQVRAHVERRFSMPFDHPAARVTDYIRCMRAIWDTFQNDTRPAYEGPFYRFQVINPFFNPGPIEQPRIPVYLAGVNPRMCRAAGEVADGFHVHPVHSAGYLRDVVRPAVAEGAKAAGRTLDGFELYAPVFVISGDSQAEIDRMDQAVRQQVAFYGSTPSYAAVLDYHGHGALSKRLNGLMREGKVAEMTAAIPDDLLDHVAIVDKPENIGRRLRERYDGLLDRVSLYLTLPDVDLAGHHAGLIRAVHG